MRLIQRLTELGDRLIVGVSTDEFNLEKGKRAIFTYPYRAEIIFPERAWTTSSRKRHGIRKVEDIRATMSICSSWVRIGPASSITFAMLRSALPAEDSQRLDDLHQGGIDRLSSVGDSDLVSAIEILEFLNRDLS